MCEENTELKVARKIVALLNEHNLTMRPYEGEISACIIGNVIILDPNRYQDILEGKMLVAKSIKPFSWEEI